MSTLDRYILSTFARNLGLVLLTLVSLYGLVEFLETVDDFIEFQASFKYYLTYPLTLLPVIISNCLPMAVLLATFATIGGLSRTSQLTAILSGGISLGKICRPLFLAGTVLSFTVVLANLWLVPWSSREANYIRHTGIKGSTAKAVTPRNLYFRDQDRVISITRTFPSKGLVQGLTVVDMDDRFLPRKRIQAESASHQQDGVWQLENAVIWEFSAATSGVTEFVKHDTMSFDLKRRPQDMLKLWNRAEDLSIGELLQMSNRLSLEGHDPKAYQMEAQLRFAKAAIPLIMVLVGVPFALQRGRDASFSLGIVISLVIFLAYFTLYSVFAVFGAISVLPPLVAAWAANLLMALIGSWFFLQAQG